MLRPAVRRTESEAQAERRRERSRSGTTVAEPQAESPPIIRHLKCARDERAFLRNGTGAVVRGFGRTAAGEVEQESALVTANQEIYETPQVGYS